MHAKTSLCACVHVACMLVTMCAICQALFFAFTLPLKNQWFKILRKWRKNAGDIIILHKCSKNHNHMRYSSWDTKWERLNFLFWATFFCHFTPLKSKFYKNKNKNFTKIKKHLEMPSFYTLVPKITEWCMLPEIWNMTDTIVCHFGTFFALLPHYRPKK